MNAIAARIINWFNSASPRVKWVVGLVGVCLLGMAGLLMLTSSPTSAQGNLTGDPLSSSPALFLDVFLKLGAVIALIVLSAFLLRRWQAGSLRSPTRQLVILESLRLSQRQAIHLIQAGDKLLLVGATDQSLTLISPVELKEAQNLQMVQKESIEFQTLLWFFSFYVKR